MRHSAFGRTLLFSAVGLLGCSAVYPELTPPIRTPPADFRLVPPPPADVFYFRFAGADIPTHTRDGRHWDAVGGEAPDPFAKLILNGKDLLVTSVESDTIRPTWADQERANYRFRQSDVLKIEVWDSNPLNNHPICSEKVPSLHDFVQGDEPYMEIECRNGGRVRLIVERAHARLGLGFSYELRTGEAVVTHVIGESPAGRAGLHAGDEIVAAMGQPVEKMEEGKLQSLVNANASTGLKLLLKSASGARELTIKDGAIYPVAGEGVPLE
ncbi:MAG TPA: PDZ domain-containing protein [Polyangiaceae bacterium]|nr:PDZ domain-containing protein [Polyangiaceae bacterium]